jgi:hypothetical protein
MYIELAPSVSSILTFPIPRIEFTINIKFALKEVIRMILILITVYFTGGASGELV